MPIISRRYVEENLFRTARYGFDSCAIMSSLVFILVILILMPVVMSSRRLTSDASLFIFSSVERP